MWPSVVLISGPPCSGKSTLARLEQERHGGTLLDWDDIRADITGLPTHDHGDASPELFARIEAEFRACAGRLVKQAELDRDWCWLIRSAPMKRHRGMLRRIYGAVGVVLAVSEAECMSRLEQSGRPASALAHYRPAIRSWWQRYEQGSHELTLRSWSPEVDPLHP